MPENNPTGEMIHVNSYIRDDGTVVEDYYRSKPGGGYTLQGGITSASSLSNLFSRNSDALNPEDVLKGGASTVKEVLKAIKIVVEKVVKVAGTVISVALPVALKLNSVYQNGKNLYNNVSDIFSSNEAKNSLSELKTSIEGLKKTQRIQSQNIGILIKKAVNTSNQEEYSEIYSEILKQKNVFDKNNTLISKIEYSTSQHDYESVCNDLQEFQANITKLDEAHTSSNIQYPEFNTSNFEQELTYQPDKNVNLQDENILEKMINMVFGIQKAYADEVYEPKTTDNEYVTINSNIKSRELQSMVNEFQYLSKISNNCINKILNGEAVKGEMVDYDWKIKEIMYNPKTNFRAIVFEKGNYLAISYVGTDFSNLKDNMANIQMGLIGTNQQMDEANDFYEQIKKENPEKTILLVGHSEGGSEAIYTGIINNVPTVTFNAYGVTNRVLPKDADHKVVYEYNSSHDMVSKLRITNDTNKNVIHPENGILKSRTPLGYADAHRLETMGDPQKALPEDEYYKQYPSFIKSNYMKFLNSPLRAKILNKMIRDNKLNTSMTNDEFIDTYISYLVDYL